MEKLSAAVAICNKPGPNENGFSIQDGETKRRIYTNEGGELCQSFSAPLSDVSKKKTADYKKIHGNSQRGRGLVNNKCKKFGSCAERGLSIVNLQIRKLKEHKLTKEANLCNGEGTSCPHNLAKKTCTSFFDKWKKGQCPEAKKPKDYIKFVKGAQASFGESLKGKPEIFLGEKIQGNDLKLCKELTGVNGASRTCNISRGQLGDEINKRVGSLGEGFHAYSRNRTPDTFAMLQSFVLAMPNASECGSMALQCRDAYHGLGYKPGQQHKEKSLCGDKLLKNPKKLKLGDKVIDPRKLHADGKQIGTIEILPDKSFKIKPFPTNPGKVTVLAKANANGFSVDYLEGTRSKASISTDTKRTCSQSANGGCSIQSKQLADTFSFDLSSNPANYHQGNGSPGCFYSHRPGAAPAKSGDAIGN